MFLKVVRDLLLLLNIFLHKRKYVFQLQLQGLNRGMLQGYKTLFLIVSFLRKQKAKSSVIRQQL